MEDKRELPRDILAEKSLIGCLIIDGRVFDEITDFSLEKGDFYHSSYGLIFESLKQLSDENKPIDYITLSSKLGEMGHLDAIGGNAFLAEISEDEASLIPRENLVVICTGSQGEKRSALFRIAYNSHNNIYLEKNDLVIFSSKDIPGNEKAINNLKNLLYAQNIEVITSDDDLVHVSGHGYAEEIKKMYQWTRPYISIPVHGEAKHLFAHSQLAQASQVPITKILDNGKCIKLAPENPKICGYLNTGKLIVEGRNLYDSESNFIKDRRKISFEGMILISIIINADLSINNKIMITSKGLPDYDERLLENDFKELLVEEYMKISNDQKNSNEIVSNLLKKLIRQSLKSQLSKKPDVKSHILRL